MIVYIENGLRELQQRKERQKQRKKRLINTTS